MLFDLKGRRRRLVQAVYLILAVLMGGGLVLFGIGGDVSGGLIDAITGGNSNSGNAVINDRIKKEEKAAAAAPKNAAPVKELIRDNYQKATDDQDQQTGAFGKDGKQSLAEVARWWDRYTVLVDKPDGAVARYAILAFGPSGLNQASKAAATAEVFAESQPEKDAASAYLQLAACATLAHQTRKATLAGEKAVELSPKKQKKSVEGIVGQAKNADTAKQICGQG